MKKLLLFCTVFVSLLFILALPLSGQSRIPNESNNWLSSSADLDAGGADAINVIFFEFFLEGDGKWGKNTRIRMEA